MVLFRSNGRLARSNVYGTSSTVFSNREWVFIERSMRFMLEKPSYTIYYYARNHRPFIKHLPLQRLSMYSNK